MNQVKFEKHKKAAFLDRDGVINEDIGYLHKIKDFIWVKGAIKALKTLKKPQKALKGLHTLLFLIRKY